jgi:hypothetical protein
MAIKKVKGIKTHQNFIFNRIASGIINTKKVRTTTVKSAPKDLAAKLVCASLKKIKKSRILCHLEPLNIIIPSVTNA